MVGLASLQSNWAAMLNKSGRAPAANNERRQGDRTVDRAMLGKSKQKRFQGDKSLSTPDNAVKVVKSGKRKRQKRHACDASPAVEGKFSKRLSPEKSLPTKEFLTKTDGEPTCPKKRKKSGSEMNGAHKIWCLVGEVPLKTDLWDKRQLASIATSKLLSYCTRPCIGCVQQIAVEVAHVHAISQLSKIFESTCAKTLGGRKWFAHFEQWLWSRRAASDSSARVSLAASNPSVVPVIPRGQVAQLDPDLERKLGRAGLNQKDARRLCKQLGLECEALAEDAGQSAANSSGGQVSVKRDMSSTPPMVRLHYSGVNVECGLAHWDKLQALFDRVRKVGRDETKQFLPSEFVKSRRNSKRRSSAPTKSTEEICFEEAAFCVIARLHSLQGAHPKCGGMQAALHGEVFDVLHMDFGCVAECFASPLNCRWGNFCSAAADVDWQFGSLGSFFDFWPESGSFEANPPFDPQVVLDMSAHMQNLLKRADQRSKPLCFVIVIPSWPNEDCWKKLRDSPFNKSTLELTQAEHGYCEGGQHYRPRRYRVSNHDSTVFFLQSEEGAVSWPVIPAKLRRLRDAFRPHSEE